MRTVVALFDRFDDAQRAIRALNDAGFPNNEINLIASDESGEYSRYLGDEAVDRVEDTADGASTGAGIGAVLGGIGGLLLGLGALAIPGVGPVIAAGPIVAALAGAGIGAVAGGLIGALVDLGIPEEHAEYYAEGVRRGGTLVTVRVDDGRADEARSLLNSYNPVDIDTRSRTWREEGWEGWRDEPVSGTLPSELAMDDHLRQDVMGRDYASSSVDVPLTTSDVVGTGQMGTGYMGGDWDMYDQTFRTDFQTRYVSSGYDYDYYQPAYRYGYELRHEDRFRGYDWDRVEPEARLDWERRGLAGAWEDVKDAVRYAWERVTD